MIIDPHAHMISRTTDDYEAMAKAGVVAVIEPAFWLGQPRTNVGSYVDYFAMISGFERFRAGQFGIRHYCTIGLNPKEANNEASGGGGDGDACRAFSSRKASLRWASSATTNRRPSKTRR